MKKDIKALLLAAGFGTRLRPLTNKIPKCLIKINNQPILARWLNKLNEIGCKSCIVNTHYLSKKVNKFIKSIHYENMEINLIYEENLLGTAGTLLKNLSFFKGKIGILLYVDNVTDFNLNELLEAHKNRNKNCILTMLTFNSKKPQFCGIVEKNKDNVMIDFFEKIKDPPNNCANGAIFIFEDDFINWIEKIPAKITDFSIDILPRLKKRVQTYHTNKVYLDIGTPESLKEAQLLFK